jgi:hypothetical protein
LATNAQRKPPTSASAPDPSAAVRPVAIVTSTARPSAVPTWAAVLSRPEASPWRASGSAAVPAAFAATERGQQRVRRAPLHAGECAGQRGGGRERDQRRRIERTGRLEPGEREHDRHDGARSADGAGDVERAAGSGSTST